jgi:hypothetical protein
MKKFIIDRLSERTTLDGLVAYGAIAYGAWTLFKKEK